MVLIVLRHDRIVRRTRSGLVVLIPAALLVWFGAIPILQQWPELTERVKIDDAIDMRFERRYNHVEWEVAWELKSWQTIAQGQRSRMESSALGCLPGILFYRSRHESCQPSNLVA